MESNALARQLIATHGRGAMQHLVDRIVAAIRDGDDATVAELEQVYKLVEQHFSDSYHSSE